MNLHLFVPPRGDGSLFGELSSICNTKTGINKGQHYAYDGGWDFGGYRLLLWITLIF